MGIKEQPDSEEPLVPGDQGSEVAKVRRPFSKIAFELDENDLSSKGVQKLLLAEISRLETEVSRLGHIEKKFHECDKELTKLKGKAQKSATLELLYSVSIAIGSVFIGFLPAVADKKILFALGISSTALFALSVFAKWKGGKDEA
jgi:hypothetical protein